MTTLQTAWTVIAAVITVLGLVIAFARVAPEDARENLIKWADFLGLQRLALRFKKSRPELYIRLGTALAAGGAGLLGNAITKLWPYFEKPAIEQSQQLTAAQAEIKLLNDQIAALKTRASPAKSGFLDLDDADRWKISSALRSETVNAGNGKPCEARIWSKPYDKSAEGLVIELPQLIQMGSWHLEGGRNSKTIFPDGVTINVGQDKGPAFSCAYRLSEILESMKIKPVSFRANVTTPDLVECKDCAEIVLGTMKKPD